MNNNFKRFRLLVISILLLFLLLISVLIIDINYVNNKMVEENSRLVEEVDKLNERIDELSARVDLSAENASKIYELECWVKYLKEQIPQTINRWENISAPPQYNIEKDEIDDIEVNCEILPIIEN